jgi:polyphosphate kinase
VKKDEDENKESESPPTQSVAVGPPLTISIGMPSRHHCMNAAYAYISAGLAWLRFNQRVLLQATRPDFPLLERCRFVSIWSSNLDEFFAARIGQYFPEGAKRTSISYFSFFFPRNSAVMCYFILENSRDLFLLSCFLVPTSVSDSRAALLPAHSDILKEAQQQMIKATEIYKNLLTELHANGVHILSPENLTITELNYFGAFLAEKASATCSHLINRH